MMAKFLKIALFFLIGILLIWWSLQQIPAQEWTKFTTALSSTKYWILFPVFILLTSAHYIRALRWRLIMEPLGYQPSILNTFLAVLIGYLANLAVPRLGEVLKCTIISKYEKVPAEKIVGTIVAERAFDVISLGLVFLIALVLQFKVIATGWHQLTAQQTSSPSQSNHFVLILLIILSIMAMVIFIFRNKFKNIMERMIQLLKGVWEGIVSATKLKKHNLFFLYSILIWFLYLTATFIGLYGTKGTESSFATAISCLAYASIGMIITPGGIGAYAFFMAKVLELNGIAYPLGLANGTIQWFAQFLIILFLGGISLAILPIINKSEK
jgi:hypothetical protein